MQGRAEHGRAEQSREKRGRAITESILSFLKRTKSQLTCLSPRFGKNTKHEKKDFDWESHIILRKYRGPQS